MGREWKRADVGAEGGGKRRKPKNPNWKKEGRKERKKGEERGKEVGCVFFSSPDPCSLGSREIDGDKSPPIQLRVFIGQRAHHLGWREEDAGMDGGGVVSMATCSWVAAAPAAVGNAGARRWGAGKDGVIKRGGAGYREGRKCRNAGLPCVYILGITQIQ